MKTKTTTANYFVLAMDGKTEYEGTENECYHALQRKQSHSADWAMKYEGWTVKEINPEFKKEWTPADFKQVEAAILKRFKNRELKGHNGPIVLTGSYKQIDNTLGLAYTSSSSYAMYGICNVQAMYDDTFHYSHVALSENGHVFAVLNDREETEKLIQLTF